MSYAPTKKHPDDMPNVDLRDPRWRVAGRGRASRRTLTLPLGGMRKAAGKTQAEVAEALDTNQGEVSRIESREDMLVSTLHRYIRALGAKVDIVVEFPNGARVLLEVKQPAK